MNRSQERECLFKLCYELSVYRGGAAGDEGDAGQLQGCALAVHEDVPRKQGVRVSSTSNRGHRDLPLIIASNKSINETNTA